MIKKVCFRKKDKQDKTKIDKYSYTDKRLIINDADYISAVCLTHHQYMRDNIFILHVEFGTPFTWKILSRT